MSTNYDVTVIFPIYGQFGAIRKPDFGLIVCKTYIFITSNLLSYKNWKQNWKISNTALTILLGVKQKKNKKKTDISKIKWVLVLYFLKLNICVYLHTRYQVSNIILINELRKGVIYPPPTSKRTPKKPTHIRINIRLNNHHKDVNRQNAPQADSTSNCLITNYLIFNSF